MNKGADILLKADEGIGKRSFSLQAVRFGSLWGIEYKTSSHTEVFTLVTNSIPIDLIYTVSNCIAYSTRSGKMIEHMLDNLHTAGYYNFNIFVGINTLLLSNLNLFICDNIVTSPGRSWWRVGGVWSSALVWIYFFILCVIVTVYDIAAVWYGLPRHGCCYCYLSVISWNVLFDFFARITFLFFMAAPYWWLMVILLLAKTLRLSCSAVADDAPFH